MPDFIHLKQASILFGPDCTNAYETGELERTVLLPHILLRTKGGKHFLQLTAFFSGFLDITAKGESEF